MARASQPPPVKLICGMLSSRAEWLQEAAGELQKQFGPADIASEIMDFDFTHYYDGQMGTPLLRQFVAFDRLVAPESLVEAKHATNRIEEEFSNRRREGEWVQSPFSAAENGYSPHSAAEDGDSPHFPPHLPLRPVNLDAGYVDSPKLVLASMKDFAHRVYLGRGVYAEVTLLYRHGLWVALEWTFPDYASGRYWPYLERVRTRLREQLGKWGLSPSSGDCPHFPDLPGGGT